MSYIKLFRSLRIFQVIWIFFCGLMPACADNLSESTGPIFSDTDTEEDTASGAPIEIDSNSDADTDADSDSDSDTDTDTDSDTDSDADSDSDSDSDTDTDTDTDSDTDSDADLDSDSDSDSDGDTDRDSDTDSVSDTESNGECGNGIIDSGEVCDGAVLQSSECDEGFTLTCGSDCKSMVCLFTKEFDIDGRIVSMTETTNENLLIGGSNGIFAEADKQGNLLWSREFENSYIVFVDETVDGNYIVIGQDYTADGFIEMTDSVGNTIWNYSTIHYVEDATSAIDGGYLVANYFEISKLDSSGREEWHVDNSGGQWSDYEKLEDLCQTGSGEVFAIIQGEDNGWDGEIVYSQARVSRINASNQSWTTFWSAYEYEYHLAHNIHCFDDDRVMIGLVSAADDNREKMVVYDSSQNIEWTWTTPDGVFFNEIIQDKGRYVATGTERYESHRFHARINEFDESGDIWHFTFDHTDSRLFTEVIANANSIVVGGESGRDNWIISVVQPIDTDANK